MSSGVSPYRVEDATWKPGSEYLGRCGERFWPTGLGLRSAPSPVRRASHSGRPLPHSVGGEVSGGGGNRRGSGANHSPPLAPRSGGEVDPSRRRGAGEGVFQTPTANDHVSGLPDTFAAPGLGTLLLRKLRINATWYHPIVGPPIPGPTARLRRHLDTPLRRWASPDDTNRRRSANRPTTRPRPNRTSRSCRSA